jgi:hypothetical protein
LCYVARQCAAGDHYISGNSKTGDACALGFKDSSWVAVTVASAYGLTRLHDHVSECDVATFVENASPGPVSVLISRIRARGAGAIIGCDTIPNGQILEDDGHVRGRYLKRAVSHVARSQSGGIDNR